MEFLKKEKKGTWFLNSSATRRKFYVFWFQHLRYINNKTPDGVNMRCVDHDLRYRNNLNLNGIGIKSKNEDKQKQNFIQ